MYNTSIKQLICAILEYLLMFFVIIEFNTPYTQIPPIGTIVFYATFLILGVLLFFNLRYLKMKLLVILVFIGSLYPALNVAEGQFSQYVKLYMILLPLLMLFLFTIQQQGEKNITLLLTRFSNIVMCFSVISLFFWICGSILEIIPPTTLIPNNWAGERFIPTYYGLYFETQETMTFSDSITSTVRNSGVFNEAPMYNMILCVALAIECFIKRKVSKLNILILMCTILSTFSTTGYIVVFFIAILKLYIEFGGKYRRQMFLFLPVISLFSLFVLFTILENKKETGGVSYNSRSADIIKCVEVGMENPILGVGIIYCGDEWGSGKNNFGYSNSLFGVFAHGGFYFFAIYFFSLFVIPLITYKKTKDKNLLSMQLCFFIVFSFTVSEYRYLTMLMMSLNLVKWDCLKNAKSFQIKSVDKFYSKSDI